MIERWRESLRFSPPLPALTVTAQRLGESCRFAGIAFDRFETGRCASPSTEALAAGRSAMPAPD